MFRQKRLNELQLRKELLLLEARVERELLALEAQNVVHSLRWVESVHRGWQRVKPLTWVAAPVAGCYLARHGTSVWRWGLRLAGAWRWVSSLRRAWH